MNRKTRTRYSVFLEWSQVPGISLAAVLVLLAIRAALACCFAHQDFWRTLWVVGSVFMGPGVLRWPAIFDLAALTAAITALFPTALLLTFLLALLTTRHGRKWAVVDGLILGLGLYFADWYGLVYWFPWLTRARNWTMLAGYLACGVAAAWLVKKSENVSRMTQAEG